MGHGFGDKMFITQALNFAESHNFKGLLGFLIVFIFFPSLCWTILFGNYLVEKDLTLKTYENDDCQDLVGWSHAAGFFYGLFVFLTILLAVWGYFVMGWEQKAKKESYTEAEIIEELESKPLLYKTEYYFNLVIKIYPGAYFFIMLVLFFGISWNHDDVDLHTCQPLASFIIVYLVLHTLFYGLIVLTICCGLVGAGAYLHQYGFDDIMNMNLDKDDYEDQIEENAPLRQSVCSHPRQSSTVYFGLKNDVDEEYQSLRKSTVNQNEGDL